MEVKLAQAPEERDLRHLRWLEAETGDRLLDSAVITTGPAPAGGPTASPSSPPRSSARSRLLLSSSYAGRTLVTPAVHRPNVPWRLPHTHELSAWIHRLNASAAVIGSRLHEAFPGVFACR
jgi:hypothetical protein